MDWLATLGMAMGSAWLSGINLYATVVTLGLLKRFDLVALPGDLGMVGEWWVIGLAGFLYIVEFIADKIPAVDSIWDAIHTFIRVPAGAVLAATAFADFDPAVRIIALLVGGGIALSSHGTKAATRLAVNTSPEPVSNISLSLAEDAATIGGTVLMVFFPVAILVIVVIFLVFSIWLIPKIVRAIRSLFARFRSRFTATGAAIIIAFLIHSLIPALPMIAAAQTGGRSPQAAVTAFFDQLKSQRYDALYDFLPSRMQSQLPREELTRSLRRLDSLIKFDRIETGRVQRRGDHAVVDTVLYGTLRRPMKIDGRDASEGRLAVQQLLFREDGRWKVVTADDRTRNLFQQQYPGFDREFQLRPPQFAFKLGGVWKAFDPGRRER
ncbi:MAG: DUF4126 family protein [Acidobacteria bacterium]|nr:DUF4126 family protein [Acidobacteriota bacterium]MCW5969970.1 DUF4126 family protein [Blastocatellales bacterium]